MVNPHRAILTVGGTAHEYAPEHEWRWTGVRNQAEGFWEVVLQSVFVSGVRVLRRVPRVVLDVSAPVIAGPAEMVEVVWGAVEGARRLGDVVGRMDLSEDKELMSRLRGWMDVWGDEGDRPEWWVYPCLNEPVVHLELGGWGFPVERVGLGRLMHGSGYCLGGIVGWPKARETDEDDRMWVVGRPFWAGVVAVFDVENKRVGMRTP